MKTRWLRHLFWPSYILIGILVWVDAVPRSVGGAVFLALVVGQWFIYERSDHGESKSEE